MPMTGSSSSAIGTLNGVILSSGSDTTVRAAASGCLRLGWPAVLVRRKYGRLRPSSRSRTERESSCGAVGVLSSSSSIFLIQSDTTFPELRLGTGNREGVWALGSRYGRRKTSSSARSLRNVVTEGSRRRGLNRSTGPRMLKAGTGAFDSARPRCSTRSVGPYARCESRTRS